MLKTSPKPSVDDGSEISRPVEYSGPIEISEKRNYGSFQCLHIENKTHEAYNHERVAFNMVEVIFKNSL